MKHHLNFDPQNGYGRSEYSVSVHNSPFSLQINQWANKPEREALAQQSA